MKLTKRALCLLLAAVMALALTIPVLAMDEPEVPEAAMADTPDVPVAASAETTITLKAGEGTLNGGHEYKITVSDGKLPLDLVPTREGWDFVGWWTGKVTETFDNNVLQAGKEEANAHYYRWTITHTGKQVKAGEPLPDVDTLYAEYKPKTVTYTLHPCGWQNKFGALKVSREYGVPFDPYVFGWNATWNRKDDTVTEIDTWTGKNGEVFTLQPGWYTDLKDGEQVTGGIDNQGKPNGGTTVGSFGDKVDLYLHWQNKDGTIDQTMADKNYKVDVRASYVEFLSEQRKEVRVHEGGEVILTAYLNPEDAMPVDLKWTSEPEGVVKVEALPREENSKYLKARVTGLTIADKADDPRTATATAKVTVSLTGKDGNLVTCTTTVIVGHNYNKIIFTHSATCTEDGEQQRECTVPGCSEAARQENFTLAALGHNYTTKKTVPATCTAPEQVIETCGRCGHVETTSKGDPLPHDFTTETTTSCGGGELKIKTCNACGYSITEGDVGNGDHEWVETITVKATCAHAGSKSTHCAKCGATKDSETIPALTTHSYGSWKTVKPATINETGLKERVCKVCEAKETQEIAKKNNYPTGGGGGGGAAPETTPTPEASPTPEVTPTPAPEVTPTPAPAPVEPPKTNNGSGWVYDEETGADYYFIDGEMKRDYWAADEGASRWNFWYYVDESGKLERGLQYIENPNGTGWYMLQLDDTNGCRGRLLDGLQETGRAGQGMFTTTRGFDYGKCVWTKDWGTYDESTGLWSDGQSHR